MKHFVILISALTVAAMSGPLCAGESNEDAAAQEIRDVLNDVWDKWDSADPDHHAHFSDDMMRIRALQDPVNWAIGSSQLMSKEQFVEHAGSMAATWREHPDWQMNREILHVNVNGDGALVAARQSVSMPDSTKRITINSSWTEVILFRKIDREWKLTHSLGVQRDQGVWHWNPE